jgi:SAM-dependent methyltransferase
MKPSLLKRLFPAHAVAEFSEVDGTVLFYNIINSRLRAGAVVLDFGAGRGCAVEDRVAWRRALAATSLVPVKRIAVDVDPAVLENPFASEKHVMPIVHGAVTIPVADSSVDVVICDWVVEHLPDPLAVFAEFNRVLRPGGMVAVRTSNYYHYAYLLAGLLGEGKLAHYVLSKAQPGRKEQDVFPKLYRANNRRALCAALRGAGLASVTAFTWDPEPAYLGNSSLPNLIGFGLHRLALAGILPRACLLGFGSKPS